MTAGQGGASGPARVRDLTSLLNPTRALVFRITHIDNIPWILDNGLHCRSSALLAPRYVEIGNPDLIEKRTDRVVPVSPGGTLSDYIPFYFTPWSPMLYNIKTGRIGARQTPVAQIVFLVSSIGKMPELGVPFVMTDRHAFLETAAFAGGSEGLDRIDWKILQARDFKRSEEDPGKMERYQAEALVHRHLPVPALLGLACHDAESETNLKSELTRRGLSLTLAIRPDWYFS